MKFSITKKGPLLFSFALVNLELFFFYLKSKIHKRVDWVQYEMNRSIRIFGRKFI